MTIPTRGRKNNLNGKEILNIMEKKSPLGGTLIPRLTFAGWIYI